MELKLPYLILCKIALNKAMQKLLGLYYNYYYVKCSLKIKTRLINRVLKI